jgi:hypothetical protein
VISYLENTKKGWWSGSRCRLLVQNPVLPKEKKEKRERRKKSFLFIGFRVFIASSSDLSV